MIVFEVGAGVNDLCFEDGILALRWDLGLEVGIWASRLGSEPQGWDNGLVAEIWAWRGVERTRRRRRKFPCVKA